MNKSNTTINATGILTTVALLVSIASSMIFFFASSPAGPEYFGAFGVASWLGVLAIVLALILAVVYVIKQVISARK